MFLVIIYIIINTILYRLQRRMRDLSRAIGMPLFIPQLTLQVNYIILITNFILLIGVSILIFITFNWLWLLIFLFYVFIGTSIIDMFIIDSIIEKLFKKL